MIVLALEGEPDRLPSSDLADAAGGWSGRGPLMCLSGLGKRGLRKNVACERAIVRICACLILLSDAQRAEHLLGKRVEDQVRAFDGQASLPPARSVLCNRDFVSQFAP
ncbi:MAG: hypothetical protein FRX49_06801 [Trebouxia sp. A1-2]|nr:MAG: hypothetical protein FRX49_06801 [Trebouxia sp. A1-2]